ncbi:MAG: DUF3015 domain-containing protein [Gammaproteobacteria bacterium]|nr:DUF3015 domain-containing protein [Gammaproteobacteria bacterium]MBU2056781.1 DUF3015 domain-containing protein [Gammaproteobacteria bacterium]MBU2174118.1 DUF3015 domain-containing protein [Gammaproteobacteria bacterium]MBU2246976.1 DUF3015 domain-containing protein [Gammaproteobacteria bacterium]MBU2343402.1 DUF3015 domain-containing protein [Gammaproteobacteria bacterium]
MKLTLVAATSAVLLSLVTSPSVQAQSGAINPWQHCGIGAMIFDNNGAAAAISNIIWDLGTTAVSSNITSDESCKGSRVAAAQFINDTIVAIEEETVTGRGDHLTAALNMMGCEVEAHSAIIEQVRTDLDLDIKGNSAKAEAFYLQLDAKVSGDFAAQCKLI